jgi:hypothetical protein
MKHTATQALVTIAIALAIVVVVKVIQARAQQQTWALPNYGRNHGVVTGPGIPKCNPWVSAECRRLYPNLLKRVPAPR